jgi:hypothetical protein
MHQLQLILQQLIENDKELLVEELQPLEFSFEIWNDGTFRGVPLVGNLDGLGDKQFFQDAYNKLTGKTFYFCGYENFSIDLFVECMKKMDIFKDYDFIDKTNLDVSYIFSDFGARRKDRCAASNPVLMISMKDPEFSLGVPAVFQRGLWMFMLLAYYTGATKYWGMTSNYLTAKIRIKFTGIASIHCETLAKKVMDQLVQTSPQSVRFNSGFIRNLTADDVLISRDFHDLLK